jgi:hypothetical protein
LRLPKTVLATIVLLFASNFAAADSCQPGPFMALVGSTCTIGSLTFNFDMHNPYGPAGVMNQGGYTPDGQWLINPIHDIQFTPVYGVNSYGFTITSSDLSFTGPVNHSIWRRLQFYYWVSGAPGVGIVRGDTFNDHVLSYPSRTGYAFGDSVLNLDAFGDVDSVVQGSFGTPGHLTVLDNHHWTFDRAYKRVQAYSELQTDASNLGRVDMTYATYMFQTAPIPEPATLSLLFIGAIAMFRRKR